MLNIKNKDTIVKNVILPAFGGFYNTIHKFDDEGIIEQLETELKELKKLKKIGKLKEGDDDLERLKKLEKYEDDLFSAYEVDYEEYENDYLQIFYDDFFITFFKLDKIGIKEIKFKEIKKPKEYNYANDLAKGDIIYNEEILEKYIKEKFSDFREYIKNKRDVDMSTEFDFQKIDLYDIIEFYIWNQFKSKEEKSVLNYHISVLDNINYYDYINFSYLKEDN